MSKMKTTQTKAIASKEVNEFAKKVKPGQSVEGMQIQDYCRDDEGQMYVLLKLDEFVKHILNIQNKED